MTGRFEHLDARPGGSHRLVLAPRGGVAVRDSGSMDSAAIAAELAPIRHRATLARRRAARASPATTQNAPAPSTAPGRPIAGVSIVDEDTRECLGGLVERSVTADRLIDVLDRLATVRGYRAMLGCGSGPELACEAMADWAGERVGILFISPGEPGAMATLSRSTAVCATNASKSTSSGP